MMDGITNKEKIKVLENAILKINQEWENVAKVLNIESLLMEDINPAFHQLIHGTSAFDTTLTSLIRYFKSEVE